MQFGALPFELASQYPVLQQTESIVKSAVPNAKLTTFTLSAMSAWTLWAQSATACGADLTQDCVLHKAQSHDDWTAGGLYPPHSTRAGALASPCIALVRLTPTGFVYDKKATDPTRRRAVQLRPGERQEGQELPHQLTFMTKRPRVACPVCELPWRATWRGDALVIADHTFGGRPCAGSGHVLPGGQSATRSAT